jgi:hypothetical protein
MFSDAAAAPAAVGWKTTLIVQLAPAAMVVPQLFVCEKLFAFAPAIVMAIEERTAFPVFERLATMGDDAVPTVLVGKTREVGDTAAMGAGVGVLEPDRVKAFGAALLAMFSDAAAAPVAVGRKTTLIVQLAATATVVPQLFVCEKLFAFAPAMVIAIEERAAFPVFERVAVMGDDAVPTVLDGNTRDVGETTAIGAGGGAAPMVNVSSCVLPAPGPGLTTTTVAVPTCAMSAA